MLSLLALSETKLSISQLIADPDPNILDPKSPSDMCFNEEENHLMLGPLRVHTNHLKDLFGFLIYSPESIEKCKTHRDKKSQACNL